MRLFLFLPFVAGFFSLMLAGISLVRRKPSPATWCFFAGMTALGVDSLFTSLGARRSTRRLDLRADGAFIVKPLVPVIWLCFSLTYSRAIPARL